MSDDEGNWETHSLPDEMPVEYDQDTGADVMIEVLPSSVSIGLYRNLQK